MWEGPEGLRDVAGGNTNTLLRQARVSDGNVG